MANLVLEHDLDFGRGHLLLGMNMAETKQHISTEMCAQIGYSRSLKKKGQENSESYQICRRLYSQVRDAAIKFGIDINGFPKRIR